MEEKSRYELTVEAIRLQRFINLLVKQQSDPQDIEDAKRELQSLNIEIEYRARRGN